MAVLFGHVNIWNMSADDSFDLLYTKLGSDFVTVSWVTGVLTLCLSPIAAVGNGLVFAAILIDPLKKIRNAPSNHLIFSLALADFLVGILACPLTACWFIYFAVNKAPPFSITLILALNYVLGATSVFSLVALTVDRHIAVTTPLQYTSKVTKRKVQITNACIWFYFIIFGIVVVILKQSIYPNAFVIAAHILIAFFAIFILNTRIVFSVRKQAQLLRNCSSRDDLTSRRKAHEREKKVAKSVFILIMVFQVFFWPFAIIQTCVYLCVSCATDLLLFTWLFLLTSVLLYCNSAVNPFLYAFCLPKYKQTFAHLIKGQIYHSSRATSTDQLDKPCKLNRKKTSARDEIIDTKL